MNCERMIQIGLFVVLWSVSGCGPATQERQQKANLQYEVGVAELNSGRYAEALKALQAAVKYNPDDPRIHNALGLIYFQQRRYDEAIKSFEKALAIDPTFLDARNHVGYVYANLKQWDRAIKEFSAIVNDPLYRTPELGYYNLGLALMETNDLIGAVQAFHKAVQLQPNFTRAFDKYGLSLFRMNRIQEAIKQFQRVIELDPDYIEAYLNLGIAYMTQDKRQDAVTQFKIVLERSTDTALTAEAQRYLEFLQ